MGPLSIAAAVDPSAAFQKPAEGSAQNGKDPLLGGKLRAKAVWVDESICIGCRYCANVASNTFVLEKYFGRSRAFRQDGDSTELIQEAIDTCPVNCIHWVDFEDLDSLREELASIDIQPLGLPPKGSKGIRPRKLAYKMLI